MGYLIENQSDVISTELLGKIYQNKYLNIIILYNLKGQLLTVRADEKFESEK